MPKSWIGATNTSTPIMPSATDSAATSTNTDRSRALAATTRSAATTAAAPCQPAPPDAAPRWSAGTVAMSATPAR